MTDSVRGQNASHLMPSTPYLGSRLTLSVDKSTMAPGESITLTAHFATLSSQPASLSTAPAAAISIVSFQDDDTVLGTGNLVDGTATLSTDKLGSGVHYLTATLNGQIASLNMTTASVVVISQKAGTVIPVMEIHNAGRTVLGGLTTPCDLKKNIEGRMQRGCEIVSSVWLPSATVIYTLTYADGSTQTFTDTADYRGHSLHPFNVALRPKAVAPGPARAIVLISVSAYRLDGTTAGTTKTRFAAQR